MPLCGHATLASGHVLYETGRVDVNEGIRFQTLSGELRARLVPGRVRGQPHGVVPTNRIELDFPALHVKAAELPKDASKLLGATPVSYHTGDGWQLAELESEKTVRELSPNVRGLHAMGFGHLIVTAQASTPGFDIASRVFVPAIGIDEDPATGSAHCVLAVWWTGQLGSGRVARSFEDSGQALNPARRAIKALQVSKRGGELEIEWIGERVMLRGKAVTVMECKLTD